MNNENVLLIATAPGAEKDLGVIGSDETVIMAETIGAEDPVTILTAEDAVTTEVGMADNLTGSFQILGQGMASIFVVLGLIAVVVAVLKKLDNKKK